MERSNKRSRGSKEKRNKTGNKITNTRRKNSCSDIEFDNKTQDDFVLVRSNGAPIYMLAVVYDDMDMSITHVIRGDDHISNTPKQILIYQAIQKAGIKMLYGKDVTIPQFAHIPLHLFMIFIVKNFQKENMP